MHHRRPSKAIIEEGRFSGNSKFLTLYSIYFSALKHKTPLFTISPESETESSSEPLHAFDPEIERTLHCLRKVRHIVTPDSSSFDSIWNSENSNFTTDESNFSEHQEAGSMENNDRTLKELTTPGMVYQPWCIQCPPLEPAQSYELKSSLIHLLPKFHGLAGEDPHNHLKEFHVAVGDTGRPYQDESVSIFLGWSCKRLAISVADSLQYLGGYEMHVPREILPSIQNSDHKEGDLWDQETLWRDTI
ncbi:hypothetical protein CR513_32601, partial [Mucuna pruriens]